MSSDVDVDDGEVRSGAAAARHKQGITTQTVQKNTAARDSTGYLSADGIYLGTYSVRADDERGKNL